MLINIIFKTLNCCGHPLVRNGFLFSLRSCGYAQVASTDTSSVSKLDVMRSRLIYQSRKRGILENCIIFTSFANKHLKTFDSAQLQKYDALINSRFDEWDLYAWAIGAKPAPEEFDNDIMSLLKNHVLKQDHNTK